LVNFLLFHGVNINIKFFAITAIVVVTCMAIVDVVPMLNRCVPQPSTRTIKDILDFLTGFSKNRAQIKQGK
jgi:hypothetical protein